MSVRHMSPKNILLHKNKDYPLCGAVNLAPPTGSLHFLPPPLSPTFSLSLHPPPPSPHLPTPSTHNSKDGDNSTSFSGETSAQLSTQPHATSCYPQYSQTKIHNWQHKGGEDLDGQANNMTVCITSSLQSVRCAWCTTPARLHASLRTVCTSQSVGLLSATTV